MSFRFPGVSHRVNVMGKTGSGKTRFGVWLHAKSRNFKNYPNVIVDYKRDDLIAQIDRAEEIGINEVPKHPGLYILRPDMDDPEIETWMRKVHERGKTGLFFDEGYMVPHMAPKFKALNRILTQGRSLRLPTMILTQRPAWGSRFARSEADFHAIFHMQDRDDYATVQGFVPRNDPVFDFDNRLPEYHSRWYDVAQDWSAIVEPVPLDDEILDLYDTALRRSVRDI